MNYHPEVFNPTGVAISNERVAKEEEEALLIFNLSGDPEKTEERFREFREYWLTVHSGLSEAIPVHV